MGLGTANGNSSLFRLDYGYGAPANNNGNMLSQAITVGATSLTQTYGYDEPLNRLSVASEAGNWSQTYQYDRYGNRWVTPSSYIQAAALTPQALSHFDSSNNRLVGSGYDLAGNLTTDATNRTFTYDAENRQTSVKTPGQGTVTYGYDGEGRRVKKTQSGQDTIYVYNVLGQLAAEFSAQGPQGAGGTQYLTADHLGSTRVVTDQSRVVKARHDYLPFGEEIPASLGRSMIAGYGGTDGIRQKFTSKERDTESNLDYFLARYYSGAQGRFTSPDPSRRSSVLTNPQTWNKYAYVLNQPFKYVDQNGKWPTAIHNLIVDLAFPGLSSRQRDAIKAGSSRIDNIVFGGQRASRSYQHSMTAPGQSPAQAQAAANGFVNDQIKVAAKQQLFYEQTGRDGVSTFALGFFGEAFHPVTDENSAMHEWQEWAGLGDYVDLLLAALHSLGETSITPGELGQAVDAARDLYRTTFGGDRLNQAIRNDNSLYFYQIWTNAFADKLIRTEPRPKRRKKGPEAHVTVDLQYED